MFKSLKPKNIIEKLKPEKGFTLIEILVVLIIIGILLIIFLPRIDFAQDQAREKGVQSDFNQFTTSSETYLRDMSGNNLTDDGLNKWIDEENEVTEANKESKKEDPWGKEYHFDMEDYAQDDSLAHISFYSSGKSGGSINKADFELHSYYKDGNVTSCTLGFGDKDEEEVIETIGIECGAELAS